MPLAELETLYLKERGDKKANNDLLASRKKDPLTIAQQTVIQVYTSDRHRRNQKAYRMTEAGRERNLLHQRDYRVRKKSKSPESDRPSHRSIQMTVDLYGKITAQDVDNPSPFTF